MTSRRRTNKLGTAGKPIRSVMKAVEILSLLNRTELNSVQHLSAETGMPKPTVMRIIGTLEQCGLVRQVSRRAGYCLTSRMLELSAGYNGLPAIIEVGAPFADTLTRELRWPAAIATLETRAMVVRYSTIPFSPYAHVASTMNKRLSLIERAHGRAYLAFCSREERDALLDAEDENGPMNRRGSRATLLRILKAARNAGYAKRAVDLDPRTSTIAAPIIVGKKVWATLGLTFFSATVDRRSEAVLARRLIESAAAFAAALREQLSDRSYPAAAG